MAFNVHLLSEKKKYDDEIFLDDAFSSCLMNWKRRISADFYFIF